MTNQSQSIVVTDKNFQELFETALIGNIEVHKYAQNQMDPTATNQLLEELADAVIESGNSVFLLMQPTLLKVGADANHEYNVNDFAHITEIHSFSAELPHLKGAYELCKSYQGSYKNLDEYLAATVE